MKLHLQLSNCSITEEGEEEGDPMVVDVEELHVHDVDSSAQVSEPEVPLYPITTYIKSVSHNSENSSNTETSRETGTTVDYISSHRPGHMEEDYPDEDEDEDGFGFTMNFFPSHGTTFKGLQVEGKLTLDAVKVNCSNYFESEHF